MKQSLLAQTAPQLAAAKIPMPGAETINLKRATTRIRGEASILFVTVQAYVFTQAARARASKEDEIVLKYNQMILKKRWSR